MFMLNSICVLMLFSVSDMSDAFYFNEANVILFLDYFKLLDKNYYVSDSEFVRKLSDYYKFEI